MEGYQGVALAGLALLASGGVFVLAGAVLEVGSWSVVRRGVGVVLLVVGALYVLVGVLLVREWSW